MVKKERNAPVTLESLQSQYESFCVLARDPLFKQHLFKGWGGGKSLDIQDFN